LSAEATIELTWSSGWILFTILLFFNYKVTKNLSFDQFLATYFVNFQRD